MNGVKAVHLPSLADIVMNFLNFFYYCHFNFNSDRVLFHLIFILLVIACFILIYHNYDEIKMSISRFKVQSVES